ncbi:MAG: class IV adenylate cyclase [Halodesulfurarchaeum sp.]
MFEVEVKVRADHAQVDEALSDMGATELGTVTQVDTYFDAPHRDFAQTDEALRLRRERGPDGGEETRITYKGPLVEAASKTRAEHETAVGSAETATKILEAVGFTRAATVRKERTRFEVDELTVTLDTVEGLGEFVEVETAAREDAIEPAREAAYDILRALGLDPEAQIRRSYLELLLEDEETAVGTGEKEQ